MVQPNFQKLQTQSRVLCDEQAIAQALDGMAKRMTEELSASDPILLGVVVGGIVTTGHLVTRLKFPLRLDYIHATRYQGKTEGGALTWKAEPSLDLRDQTVVVVDDVLDAGITLQAITERCLALGAKTVKTAVLIDKASCRVPEGLPSADYVGLTLGDEYVYGFGLDYEEYLRNEPEIRAVVEA